MRMIVCIKIGENEPNTYEKFNRLSKHFDIIDVLPRGKTSLGIEGDKEYLAINVDTDSMTDEEYNKLRWKLREDLRDTTALPNEEGEYPRIAKRKWKLSDEALKLLDIGIDNNKLNKINSHADKKRNKQKFNMKEISDFNTKIPLSKFAKAIEGKHGKTLEEELGK
jgi:hypothetical protein